MNGSSRPNSLAYRHNLHKIFNLAWGSVVPNLMKCIVHVHIVLVLANKLLDNIFNMKYILWCIHLKSQVNNSTCIRYLRKRTTFAILTERFHAKPISASRLGNSHYSTTVLLVGQLSKAISFAIRQKLFSNVTDLHMRTYNVTEVTV